MNNLVTIANISIRQDSEGRYSLNDLHRASGAEKRHGPSYWLGTQQTRELIAELETTGIPVVTLEGRNGGTFVAKELVYAYAMWISAAFHLKVIRAYDQIQAQPQRDPMDVLADPAAMRGLLLNYTEKVLALESRVQEQAPKVEVFERIADAAGSVTIRETANTLRVPERKFVLWLLQNDWCYRRAGHKSLLAYADKVKAGYLVLKQTPIKDAHTGEERLSEQVRVTPLGLTVLAGKLSVVAGQFEMPVSVLAHPGSSGYVDRRY